MGLEQFSERSPYNRLAVALAAAGTDTLNLAAPAVTVRLDHLYAYSTVATDKTITILYAPVESSFYPIVDVIVPASAGHAGVPLVDLFVLAGLSDGLVLGAGDTLNIQLVVALSDPETIVVLAAGGYL